MRTILMHFVLKYEGHFDKILKALKNKEKVEFEQLEEIEKLMKQKKLNFVTIIDSNYPETFKYLSKPPFAFFYKGNIAILDNPNKIALTGDFNNKIVSGYLDQSLAEVSKTQVLISSYFKNLEVDIIKYYQENIKPMILISANGLEEPYFAKQINANENTLIISEFPENVHLSKRKLKSRNRLIASLANNLVIFSSKKDSKINHLVSQFLELGKEINCFPKSLEKNDGNECLISQGATRITGIRSS